MKTALKTLHKALAIFLIILMQTGANAATATATVSANIVPLSAISLSSAIVVSSQPNKLNGSLSHINNDYANGGNVSLSTDGVGKARLKIRNYGNITYSVSIKSPSYMKYKSEKKITTENLYLIRDSIVADNETEHTYQINGAFTIRSNTNDITNEAASRTGANLKPIVDEDPYKNMISLTVNYN